MEHIRKKIKLRTILNWNLPTALDEVLYTFDSPNGLAAKIQKVSLNDLNPFDIINEKSCPRENDYQENGTMTSLENDFNCDKGNYSFQKLNKLDLMPSVNENSQDSGIDLSFFFEQGHDVSFESNDSAIVDGKFIQKEFNHLVIESDEQCGFNGCYKLGHYSRTYTLKSGCKYTANWCDEHKWCSKHDKYEMTGKCEYSKKINKIVSFTIHFPPHVSNCTRPLWCCIGL